MRTAQNTALEGSAFKSYTRLTALCPLYRFLGQLSSKQEEMQLEIAKVELKVLEDGVKQADSQAIAHLSDLELALVGGGGGDIVWT